METNKNIGVIEFNNGAMPYKLDNISHLNGYQVKKVLVNAESNTGAAKENYPGAEIVDDKTSLFDDTTIELVIINAPANTDLNLVAEALEAGKQVRVL